MERVKKDPGFSTRSNTISLSSLSKKERFWQTIQGVRGSRYSEDAAEDRLRWLCGRQLPAFPEEGPNTHIEAAHNCLLL